MKPNLSIGDKVITESGTHGTVIDLRCWHDGWAVLCQNDTGQRTWFLAEELKRVDDSKPPSADAHIGEWVEGDNQVTREATPEHSRDLAGIAVLSET